MSNENETFIDLGSLIAISELHNDMIQMIDKYLANYNKESFILDDENYEDFFDGGEKGYKAIVVEKDNYNIPCDAGDGISSFNSAELALIDLITRLLLEKGN